jgi:hypothetical protein
MLCLLVDASNVHASLFFLFSVWVISIIHILWLRHGIIQVLSCVRSWSSMVCTLIKLYMNLSTHWKMDCLFCVAKWLVSSRWINGFTLFATVGLSWILLVAHTIVVVAMLLCSVVHPSMSLFSFVEIFILLCLLYFIH